MQHNFAHANFITNIANFSTNRALQNLIAKGQQQIIFLNNQIKDLQLQIDSLDADLEHQRAEAKNLYCKLQKTRQVLKCAIVTVRFY